MRKLLLIALTAVLYSQSLAAQDSTKTDSVKIKKFDSDLPLQPERTIAFTAKEGSWMSLDISPDGKQIVFDLMGDLYIMPITGGKADTLTRGMAYDVHPRFSPDGKSIVYISDRSGSDNVWIMDLATKEKTAITKSDDDYFPSAEWTPDGKYIVASKGRRNMKLFMYHKDGGRGVQLIDKPSNLKTIDPAVTPDGRYIYFSRRFSGWNYNAQLPQFQIGYYDREDGSTSTVTSRYGSAFTPTFSPDGKYMVYGTRFEDKTGLVLRTLATGEEAWLAYPVQRDEQESIAPLGVLPAMSFTPDNKAVYASFGGKIFRIEVPSGKISEVAFEADVNLQLGPKVSFDYPIEDDEELVATQIRDAIVSPDGKKLAFTALNRLYYQDLPSGKPVRLTDMDYTQANLTWSPDGKWIAFATWKENEGGHIYKVEAKEKKPKLVQLTKETGLYYQPAWSWTGDKIAFLKGSAAQYNQDPSGFAIFGAIEDIAWISAAKAGDINFIAKANGKSKPHFVKNSDRIFMNGSGGTLVSIRWDGTDEKEHLKVTGITTFGTTPEEMAQMHDNFDHNHRILHPDMYMKEVNLPSPASEIIMAPEGDQAIALINNDVYTVTVPQTGQLVSVSVSNPSSAQFPSRKLTEIGGQFPSWSGDSKTVHWAIGNAFFSYNLDKAKAFDDSVKAADKAEKLAKEAEKNAPKDTTAKMDSAKTDSVKAEPKKEDKKKKEKPSFKADEMRIKVMYKQDIPKSSVLLTNARIITMKGNEVIERGDIWIENNRIKAVAASGKTGAPASVKPMDMTGKTIIPGFVDPHAHMWPTWEIHKNQDWQYTANLAYGVTTTRDPQTSSTDVLTYSDMVRAGKMAGPRIYSTGPGLGFWFYNLKDLEQTRQVMKQYSEYYHTKTLKMYLVGNRKQRQWVIQAAKEQNIMPTTEGGLDFKLNMTQLLDGYPGHEHALPIYPLFSDVFRTISEAGMAVNPTLLVSYGGPWAENYYYATEDPYNNAKLKRFTPYEELASKSRRRGGWFHPDEHVFKKHAENMKNLVEAGGTVGVGSHGQLQGLGFHWELWSMASGGMSNHDALKTATIMGATQIGLGKDVGSIEVGKMADLVILNANPLENIRNTDTITMVMINGRLYNGDTLEELYPTKAKPNLGVYDKAPVNTTGLKN
ncbi:amidohydrolase [bacterium]|nr:MAG: amidohydrolase [bacterium]